MEKTSLKEIAGLFLKLGFTAFGGPAAHIAMMREEVVIKKSWMDEQHFLDLIGATNLIPGPNSTEMAIHIGQERRGWKGLIVAGFCFIMPAVLITGCFAILYKLYGTLPQVKPFVFGIKPAVIAVILVAIYPLAKKTLVNLTLITIGAICLLLSLFNFSEVLILFGSGFLGMAIHVLQNKRTNNTSVFTPFLFLIAPPNNGTFKSANFKLFLSFLKIGSILYGSGYVLFAFLDSELVARGIITRQQLLDAIAVGQFTPGPVFSSVTFIGYQINGLTGAALATIGIFLPSFLFVALLNPLVRIMRKSGLFAAFLNAVNVASLALIVSICYNMGNDSLSNWRSVLIGITSAIVLFKFKSINSAFIILGGAVIGFLLLLI